MGGAAGIVTSGGFGHRAGRQLALALLRDPGFTQGLTGEILGRHHGATIIDEPHFDPINARMKG
ncbi:MAG: hypothetical protein GY717_18925 [Rhodobacteraceae bacterium]|nr:hypothetical protein [Paracoccaceae bacterium]